MTSDQEAATQILKNTRAFVEGNTSTEYLLVNTSDESPQVGTLEFQRTVQRELEKLASDILTPFIDDVRDGSLTIRPLSAGNSQTDEAILQYAHIGDLPDTELFQTLKSPLVDYPSTKFDEENPPDFQLIRSSDGNKAFIGIQNRQALKTYSPKKEGIPLMYTNEVYERFEGDLLVVPKSINAIYYDGHVLVRSPKSFERMFNMREEYEEKASSVMSNFEKAGIKFADPNVREEWLETGEIRILRKLHSVHENDIPKYATPDKVRYIIDEYGLSVSYTKNNGQIELDIENYTDIWELLRLLNDDYAESELIPDGKMEIESKRFIDV